MSPLRPILGFVGPSGSGKTFLIHEMLRRFPDHLGIAKSITTRPQRDPEDALFYDFVAKEDIDHLEQEGRLTHRVEFAGTHYATDRKHLDELLSQKMGVCAFVQDGVRFLRNAGYEIKVIEVVPVDQPNNRDEVRHQADAKRFQEKMPADITIMNSFHPGGKEKAIGELAKYIERLISKK
jgi:guanylate kinase